MTLREPWRTRLLFLSFAVNLAALPIAATRLYNMHFVHPPTLPPGVPPPEMMIRHMADALPSEEGKRLTAAMEPHVEDIQIARIRMEAARRGMIRSMTATPFDAETARVEMRKWQSAWTVWSESLGSAMLDGVAGLSPEGRNRLRETTLPRRNR